MIRDKVNLAEKLASFDDAFQPQIVGCFNGHKLMVAKTRGEFVWHSHPDTDDLFLVVKGTPHDPAARPGRGARARASSTSCRRASSTARAPTTRRTSC